MKGCWCSLAAVFGWFVDWLGGALIPLVLVLSMQPPDRPCQAARLVQQCPMLTIVRASSHLHVLHIMLHISKCDVAGCVVKCAMMICHSQVHHYVYMCDVTLCCH